MTTETRLARKVRLRQKKAAGKCYRCLSKKAECGGRCAVCAEKQRAYNRLYWRRTH